MLQKIHVLTSLRKSANFVFIDFIKGDRSSTSLCLVDSVNKSPKTPHSVSFSPFYLCRWKGPKNTALLLILSWREKVTVTCLISHRSNGPPPPLPHESVLLGLTGRGVDFLQEYIHILSESKLRKKWSPIWSVKKPVFLGRDFAPLNKQICLRHQGHQDF